MFWYCHLKQHKDITQITDWGRKKTRDKVTGVYFRCFLSVVAKSCPTLSWPYGPSVHRSPRQGCHFLFQGIFLTHISCIGKLIFLTSEPPGKPHFKAGWKKNCHRFAGIYFFRWKWLNRFYPHQILSLDWKMLRPKVYIWQTLILPTSIS